MMTGNLVASAMLITCEIEGCGSASKAMSQGSCRSDSADRLSPLATMMKRLSKKCQLLGTLKYAFRSELLTYESPDEAHAAPNTARAANAAIDADSIPGPRWPGRLGVMLHYRPHLRF